MKKALALILTAAMLLSCLALGVAAKREVTVGEASKDGAWYAEGENYNNWWVSETTSFVTEIKLMGSSEHSGPALTTTMSYTPYIDIAKDKVGYGDFWATGGEYYLVDYDFNVDTWYTVKYVTDGGKTEVYVNDAYVTTFSDSKLTAGTGNTIYGCYISDYKITNLDGSVIFHEDFEDDALVGEGPSGGSRVVFEGEAPVSNVNAMYVKDGAWYAEGENYNNWWVSETTSFRTSIKLMGSSEHSGPALTTTMSYTPYIDIAKDKVGYGDFWATGGEYYLVDYDFDVDTWYTVVYETEDGVTDVYVNDEYVTTFYDSKLTAGTGNTIYGCYIADYKITNLDGSVIFHEDFEDASFAGEGPSGGSAVAFEIEGNKYDLGLWYWNNYEGASYNPVNVGNQGANFDVEMDICLDTDSSGLTSAWDGLAKAPVITTKGVGVSSVSIAYDFEVGTWYHVKWDAEDGKTAIYVDDAYVGTVDGAATLYEGNQAFWCWDKISFDNIKVGSFFADMENGNLNDGQGARLEYDLGIVEEDPLKDVPKFEAGGDAYLLEGTSSFTYLYAKKNGLDTNSSIVSFDLAIIPNVENTKNEDGAFFEFWRDGGYKRFRVSPVGAGRGDDVTAFADLGIEWGATTPDNLHNVVFWFENAKGTIYIDGVEVYSGIAGDPFDQALVMSNINCSVVIDNFKIYNLDMDCIMDMDDLRAGWQSDSATDPVKVNVDAADYCAENGHIFYEIKRTKTETCTATGVDTTYCAICGEGYANVDVAMVAHQYEKFDANRTVDGKYYTNCKACGDRNYSTIPAADSYTGSIVAYFDMSDAFLGNLNNSYETALNSNWFGDQFRYEDGKAVLDADSYLANYSELQIGDKIQQNVDARDWSYSYRMTFNGLFDTDDILNSGYPHTFYFWLRGVTLELGYNADLGELYIGPSANPGAVSIDRIAAPFEFKEGLTYTFKFGFKYIDEDMDAFICLWINDELILEHSLYESGADIYFDCELQEDFVSTIYPRNFGYSYTMDDLVIGSFDFAWNKVEGDVDNDGVLSVADAMVMRKYLAKVIDDEAVFVELLDVNGDAAVNAKDQLAIRKALAA